MPISGDPLLAYSRGRLARNEAIRLLGLRDYAALLVALEDADLPMPLPAAFTGLPDGITHPAAIGSTWQPSGA
jgi:hypothetical protein